MGRGSESFGFPLDAVLYSSFGDLPKIFGSYRTFVFFLRFSTVIPTESVSGCNVSGQLSQVFNIFALQSYLEHRFRRTSNKFNAINHWPTL